MIDSEGKKRCPRCSESKIAEEHFYRVNRTDCDGFAGYCKACTKAKVIAWQKANPDKKRAQDRKTTQLPGFKEKRNGYARKSYAKHADKRRAYHRDYSRKNPDKAKAKAQKWAKANPQAIRDFARVRHARVRASGGKMNRRDWLELLVRFAHACAYCGAQDCKLTLEHLTPVSKGGRTERGNVVPACMSCNSSKQDKDLEVFAGSESAGIIRRMAA